MIKGPMIKSGSPEKPIEPPDEISRRTRPSDVIQTTKRSRRVRGDDQAMAMTIGTMIPTSTMCVPAAEETITPKTTARTIGAHDVFEKSELNEVDCPPSCDAACATT